MIYDGKAADHFHTQLRGTRPYGSLEHRYGVLTPTGRIGTVQSVPGDKGGEIWS